MGNIPTDRKLQLVRMIRAENQDNRMKLKSRERMLYGGEPAQEELPLYTRGYTDAYGGKKESVKETFALESGKEESGREGSFSFFKLRLILSVLLFSGFLLLDAGGGKLAGMTAGQLREEINRDFDAGLDTIVFDFEDNFPYTLFKNKE